MRLVDGLTLQPGENQFAGMPDVVWTLIGQADFTADHADVQYVVTTSGLDQPDTTAYAFIGRFDVDRNTLSITQDFSGAIVQLGVRRGNAYVMVGESVLDTFTLFDGDGNEVLWVRR